MYTHARENVLKQFFERADVKMSNSKIIQIIPGNNFLAVYDTPEGDIKNPVICFALVENEKGERRVLGMDSCDLDKIDFCEAASNFIGYRK